MNFIKFKTSPNFGKDNTLFFRDREEEREKERERNISQLPLLRALTGEQTCNPHMCPDQESKQWPFSL